MNVKISKKRAAKIMQEEVAKFLAENKDIDPKILEQFILSELKGAQKWKDGWFSQLEDARTGVSYE